MSNIFTKKKSEEHVKRKEIRGYIVPKTMVKKFESKKFEPKKFEPERPSFKLKYRDTKTGEIFTIDLYDEAAYDKMMNNGHAQLLFGD